MNKRTAGEAMDAVIAEDIKRQFIILVGVSGGYERQKDLFRRLLALVGQEEADAFWMKYYGHSFYGYDES